MCALWSITKKTEESDAIIAFKVSPIRFPSLNGPLCGISYEGKRAFWALDLDEANVGQGEPSPREALTWGDWKLQGYRPVRTGVAKGKGTW